MIPYHATLLIIKKLFIVNVDAYVVLVGAPIVTLNSVLDSNLRPNSAALRKTPIFLSVWNMTRFALSVAKEHSSWSIVVKAASAIVNTAALKPFVVAHWKRLLFRRK